MFCGVRPYLFLSLTICTCNRSLSDEPVSRQAEVSAHGAEIKQLTKDMLLLAEKFCTMYLFFMLIVLVSLQNNDYNCTLLWCTWVRNMI